MPFRHVGDTVEVRGVAGAVVALKDCAVIARHPRGTDRRLVIDQAHYDGPSTDRVVAPPPLGRMGARIPWRAVRACPDDFVRWTKSSRAKARRALAAAPVARRSIDLYAALAAVAR